MKLYANPKKWSSWNFYILSGAQAVAEINMSWWHEKAKLTVAGTYYKAYREGLFNGDFVLKTDGVVLARAKKPDAFFRRFIIDYQGRQFILQAKSILGRAFLIFEGVKETGSIAPEGFFTRRAVADLPEELPMPVKLFLIWLVLILWKREADSSPAAGGAGSI